MLAIDFYKVLKKVIESKHMNNYLTYSESDLNMLESVVKEIDIGLNTITLNFILPFEHTKNSYLISIKEILNKLDSCKHKEVVFKNKGTIITPNIIHAGYNINLHMKHEVTWNEDTFKIEDLLY